MPFQERRFGRQLRHGYERPSCDQNSRSEKCFGPLTAVDQIDFEVYRGECFGILGPNGAGKTSAMRMLYNFSPRTSGTLGVFGLDPAREGVRLRPRARWKGFFRSGDDISGYISSFFWRTYCLRSWSR
ncbi:MAG: ATP-binding cassette domain-containing protein [Deltaproteobacteria bacterium]|nr:ATP-binding cassette domain-containing protein [Deltaproteobacteria bacterium]